MYQILTCCSLWLNCCHFSWNKRFPRGDLTSKKRKPCCLTALVSTQHHHLPSSFCDGPHGKGPSHFILLSFMSWSQYKASSFHGNHSNFVFRSALTLLLQVDYIMNRKVRKRDWRPLTAFAEDWKWTNS